MSLLLRFSATALAVLFATLGARAVHAETAIFPGDVGPGTIPDNSPAGRQITFEVEGLTRPVFTVALRLNLAHTWMADLDAVLTSPSGRARMVVFSRIGTRRLLGAGDSSDFGGLYEFTDLGGNDLWAGAEAATGAAVVPAGRYRAMSAGNVLSANGGCPTSLTGVFGGLTPAQANGVWTLTIADRGLNDTGTVSVASLIIDDTLPSLFSDGFENQLLRPVAKGLGAVPRCFNKVQADFNGDGLTDFVLARPVNGNVQWIVRHNLGNGTATPEADATTFILGSSSAFVDTLDYDGDRIADAMAWNESTGVFSIRRSSRTIDPEIDIAFGQAGDDPTQSGDYDGDARDDLGLFRTPLFNAPAGPMNIVIRQSDEGTISSIFIGTGVDGDAFPTAGFDFDGDALADISVQDQAPGMPGDSRHTLFNGRTGEVLDSFVFGTTADFITPGNFIGSRHFDTLTRRIVSNMRHYQSRDSATGMLSADEVFGTIGDQSIGGDYDGDGLSDLAVWRGSSVPGASRFLVRSSLDIATTWELPGGQAPTPSTADFAVAGSRVH
jgi:hypothetical protein